METSELLTVRRSGPRTREVIWRLLRSGEGFVVQRNDDVPRPVSQLDALKAVRGSRRLRVARLRCRTDYVLPQASPITLDDLLEVLLLDEGGPVPDYEDWEEVDLEAEPGWVDDTCLGWGSTQRITVNGARVVPVQAEDGQWVVVPACDVDIGFDDDMFEYLVRFVWDSTTYGCPAGWGSENLYRVRRNLYARISTEDGGLGDVSFFRSNRHPRDIVVDYGRRYFGPSDISLLAQQAGLAIREPVEPNPDDDLWVALSRRNLRYVVRKVAEVTGPARRRAEGEPRVSDDRQSGAVEHGQPDSGPLLAQRSVSESAVRKPPPPPPPPALSDASMTNMLVKDYSRAELDSHVVPLINRWLEAGAGVAVYESAQERSASRQYLTFGVASALLKTSHPPNDLPAGEGRPCALRLVGVYQGFVFSL